MPKIGEAKRPRDSNRCIACGGKGKSSKGAQCVPCRGTGKKQDYKYC